MSKNLPAIHSSLDTVKLLRKAVSDAIAQEEEVERLHRLERARSKREHDERIASLDAEHDTMLAEAQSTLHHASKSAEAKHQRRSQWIQTAANNARTQVTEAVAGQKGSRISKVQAQTLKAKRQHETDLSDARKAIAALEGNLLAHKQVYQKLQALALASFRGFPLLYLKIKKAGKQQEPDDSSGGLTQEEFETSVESSIPLKFEDLLLSLKKKIADYGDKPLPRIFRYLPLQFLVPIGIAITLSCGYLAGWESLTTKLAGAISAGAMFILLILQRVAAATASKAATSISQNLRQAGAAYLQYAEKSQPWIGSRCQKLEKDLDDELSLLNKTLGSDIESAEQLEQDRPTKLAHQQERLNNKNSDAFESAMAGIRQANEMAVDKIKGTINEQKKQAEEEQQSRLDAAESAYQEAWKTLEDKWNQEVPPVYKAISDDNDTTSNVFPDWSTDIIANWQPPANFFHAANFGHLEVDLETLAGGLPGDNRISLPGDASIQVPLALRFPEAGSIIFETESSSDPKIIGAMNNILLRLLSVAPPGKLNFSIFDPVGLGQNFAGITHLADYEDSIINERIWTQREQIETRISELNEHMEKVIQMYLRNEYETITDYNEQAGNIAEKYHFLIIADFPGNFSEAATRGLLSIAASGARCGIYTLIHWDKRQPTPEAFVADDIRKTSTSITQGKDGTLQFVDQITPGSSLHFNPPPPDALATEFVHQIGSASSDSNRVEVPFSQIMPAEGDFWQGDTTNELRIPIGRTGATKLQNLAIGKGTRQHALFAGKTGSGKSTLFHVMITNLALSCSPDQVEFYLIDFKKGVEFKCYGSKKLPHARVVAIESDREFGLSVLQRLDEELKRRGELFREAGVQDLAAYRNSGNRIMPRTLLIIDEFQEFFVEDDRIAQNASVLLDRIVRQGRAFGIHVLLGSQTLGGAYSLARATLGQMVIRVALQCNEADAYLIMDESNPAPRLLTRPGEGIYNDSAGAIGGNSPFQTVWLPEDERDSLLDRISELSAKHHIKAPAPIVFEGNAPADIRENSLMEEELSSPPEKSPTSPKVWLGAPNAIKGPTEAVFHRQSGNHMLIVGQRDDATAAIMASSILALCGQVHREQLQLVVIDGNPPGSPERELLDGMYEGLPHEVRSNKDHDIITLIGEVASEMKRREEEQSTGELPPIFVFINGLQRFKKLRYDDDLAYSFDASSQDSNPALQLNDIICEGSALGIHLIASIDSYNNIGRTLSRKALSEFEMRILFQMSSNDSAALVDSSKGASLGMHRALFYNEHEGYLETFRPYALPGEKWLSEACKHLR
ncbi:MAG: ATP-binding protein [Verrucomicrobiaceae bacterium]|nr:ATP-binding protein [Verrucomicrobiaceae bacterium]